MAGRRVMTYEGAPGSCAVTGTHDLDVGQSAEVGREGRHLALGVAVPTTTISRVAATVTATEHGWEVTVSNRNGAVLHPWGQPPELAQPTAVVNWPFIAVRMLPDSPVSQHWVLIEADELPVTPTGPVVASGALTETDKVDPPGQLPRGEREALQTVFAAQLSWPPAHPAQQLQLKQAGARLGISISGVQDRLKAARARAARLGQPESVGLTDPAYLYALVRAGYLDAPGRLAQD